MKITALSAQQRDPNRVNVSVDGKYTFSLDIAQVVSLGVKVGREYTEKELVELEQESQFGKLYGRSLEYCLMRPHSKMRTTRYKSKKTGEMKERPGVSQAVADRVFERLVEKGYVDDEKFARFWVENRNQAKGASRRKLEAELRAKGLASSIIAEAFGETERTDADELQKIIAKKIMVFPLNRTL